MLRGSFTGFLELRVVAVLPTHSHSSPHALRSAGNLRSESAMGFGQSFPERRVEVLRCFNVHVQTCSSFITSKRRWEDSLDLSNNPPRNHACSGLLSALGPPEVLLARVSDSYANETEIQPLKEKSTSPKSAP